MMDMCAASEIRVGEPIAGPAHEEMSSDPAALEAPTKDGSRPGPLRRPSLTLEAKSVAMKLAGLKPTPGSNKHHHGHARSQSSVDYFTLAEQSYSAPPLELLSPIDSLSASTKKIRPSRKILPAQKQQL